MNNSYTSASDRGFTLIELLVVVLIIGILAAVALPQYTKAVEKARLTEALSNIKTMQNNIDLYLLENGGFPNESVSYKDMETSSQLGVEGGTHYETKNFLYAGACGNDSCNIQVNRLPVRYTLYLYRNGSSWYQKQCITQKNDFGRQVCKSLQEQGWLSTDGEI